MSTKTLPEVPGAPKRKLAPRWIGPFEVLSLAGPNAVKLKNLPVWAAVHDTVNVEKLKPTTGPPGTQPPAQDQYLDPGALLPGSRWETDPPPPPPPPPTPPPPPPPNPPAPRDPSTSNTV